MFGSADVDLAVGERRGGVAFFAHGSGGELLELSSGVEDMGDACEIEEVHAILDDDGGGFDFEGFFIGEVEFVDYLAVFEIDAGKQAACFDHPEEIAIADGADDIGEVFVHFPGDVGCGDIAFAVGFDGGEFRAFVADEDQSGGEDRGGCDLAIHALDSPDLVAVFGVIGDDVGHAVADELVVVAGLDDDGGSPGCHHLSFCLPDEVTCGGIEGHDGGIAVCGGISLVILDDEEAFPDEEGGGVTVGVFGESEVFCPGFFACEVEGGDVAGGEEGIDPLAVGGGGIGRVTAAGFAEVEAGVTGLSDGLFPFELTGGGVEAVEFAFFRGGACEEDFIFPDDGGGMAGQFDLSFPEDVVAAGGIPACGVLGGGGDSGPVGSAEGGPVFGELLWRDWGGIGGGGRVGGSRTRAGREAEGREPRCGHGRDGDQRTGEEASGGEDLSSDEKGGVALLIDGVFLGVWQVGLGGEFESGFHCDKQDEAAGEEEPGAACRERSAVEVALSDVEVELPDLLLDGVICGLVDEFFFEGGDLAEGEGIGAAFLEVAVAHDQHDSDEEAGGDEAGECSWSSPLLVDVLGLGLKMDDRFSHATTSCC